MHDVSVVHLVWRPLGREVLSDFVAAYRRHTAGMPHQLVVVYNGFTGESDRAPFAALLAGVEHDALVLPDPVQDLPAYRAAARALGSEYVCFLNSYSAPLAPGWLAMLHAHAARPGVGLVGASGSWESYLSNLSRGTPNPLHAAAACVKGLFRRSGRRYTPADYFQRRRDLRDAAQVYDRFPAPHVRTNAFMLRRELMLSLDWPAITTKPDALAFESGRAGLTRQVQARGLRALVVGRDSRAFAPDEWWASGTYRCGAQANLLVADNRTREFDAVDAATRARVAWETWGERRGVSTPDAPGTTLPAGQA